MYQAEKNLVAKFMQVEDITTYDPANKWEQLIPVCAKIDNLDIPDKIDLRKDYVQLCDDLDNAVTIYEKYPVFRQVIRCIEWYNQRVIEEMKPPPLPINMIYKGYYIESVKGGYWVLVNRESDKLIARSVASSFPRFKVPEDWLTSRSYAVELQMVAGCSNSKCNWECNGCTSKATILDIKNHRVTILKYL